MTPEQKRIAIAEYCGWREAFPQGKKPHKETRRVGILLPYIWVNENTHVREMVLPDYLNDLNAMHEAVRYLRDNGNQFQWLEFHKNLFAIVWDRPITPEDWTSSLMWEVIEATAQDRADAFLLTIGQQP